MEALFKLICEVLQDKGVDINQMRFNGFDGTNTMSGEISGLQRRFCHLVPHSLVFVHLLPKYKTLMDVDAVIISVWKLMKYSTVKASVFGAAQTAVGEKNLKLLKAAPTRWLSDGEASKRLVSRFESLVDALDTLISGKAAPDIKGIRDELLEPNTILVAFIISCSCPCKSILAVFTNKKLDLQHRCSKVLPAS